MKKVTFVFYILIILIFGCKQQEINSWLLCPGYTLYINSVDDLALRSPQNEIIVNGNIEKCLFDDIFITVKERPRFKIYKLYNLDKFKDTLSRNRAFDTIDYYEFWIINRKETINYGPFQKEEFIRKMKELYVPGSLYIN